MPVIDSNSQELLGYISDISPGGFRLESQKPLTVDKDYTVRLERTIEIANKAYILLVARAVWGQPDPITPNEYLEGFKIVSISKYEQEIYARMVEKYSTLENRGDQLPEELP